MSHEDKTTLTAEEARDRAWELAEKINICMFVTWDGERQRARPLAANVMREEHAIYFLVDVNGMKDDQIERFPIVTMAFADTGSYKFVSITGEAVVTNDRAKIEELWTPDNKAFWDSKDDPNIRVITVKPDDAEVWDSPGKIVSAVKMLTAAVTGAKMELGNNRKVTM
ncbi:pyridoxamine 5'-phosphate oxidase family protein [Mesorhizobium sp. VNQ89]|uniref:pyridoxamine 5'-phosphate oxidase family protein n=1 Tax=Mesorhizobium quangtriensis TaxID=3157709 RepID=UPI0032B75D09